MYAVREAPGTGLGTTILGQGYHSMVVYLGPIPILFYYPSPTPTPSPCPLKLSVNG